MKALFGLSGKAAVVTGGAGYLGAAICRGLAQYGASVVVASRDAKSCAALARELEELYPAQATGAAIDILDAQSIQSFFLWMEEKFGGADILVNNAYTAKPGLTEALDEEDWYRGLDGTIGGVYRCVKAALPAMVRKRGGSIINIASMYGVMAPDFSVYEGMEGQKSPLSYGAGKAAILQFTRTIASRYGQYGIRANCISPGPFPHGKALANEDFVRRLADKTMLHRVGQAEEIAGAAVFLASDAASYITAQNICVDGGATAW
jgi:gluconate 5-dehydrogenase